MRPSIGEAGVRLDKWLWFARFCKTRSLAQKLIDHGQITLNGSVAEKPGILLRRGDRLTVVLGPVMRTVVVSALGVRRGSAGEARALYEEIDPPRRLPAGQAALPLWLLR